jgi:UDP-N-acetyl-D-glucosamine/UDP-N-acetyl-D-galactosamine dehydrogenase
MKKAPEFTIGVIGLGYVGLPLLMAFFEKYSVVGYDIDLERIKELNSGKDITNSVEKVELIKALNENIRITSNPSFLRACNVFIVTVPTDINEDKSPNLKPLELASRLVGEHLKANDLVIFESTTFPGCTEEFCMPILEKESGLVCNRDFSVGYSPERISVGDYKHKLSNIVKVTSASNNNAATIVDRLYKSIIQAGTHLAPSIKVAEASKAIENAQRDLNISFINEIAIIFSKMNIETDEVLKAARTKWNFLDFTPGLVGGHCIGVDPYYLLYKSRQLGYEPEVIKSGRSVNEYMVIHVANTFIKLVLENQKDIKKSRAIILGFSFKENTSDIRNSKVPLVYQQLIQFGLRVDLFDPLVSTRKVKEVYDINMLTNMPVLSDYNAILIAVGHDLFKSMNIKKSNNTVIYDLKGFLPKGYADSRL